MYEVKLEAQDKIIDCRICGLLSPIEAKCYTSEVEKLLIQNQLHRGYRLIVDISKCVIQTQETIATLSGHMIAMPKADRIAVIIGGSLASGQARRLFTQPYARLVSTRQQALDWINSKDCQVENVSATYNRAKGN